MGNDYTLSTFLRQTPNGLLKEYFGSNGTRLSGVDFDALKKTEYSPVLEAIDKLDNGHRDQIEQDFQDVFLLADKPGTQIIIDLADLHGLDIADALEAMDNHYHRAMWLFLNRQHNGTDLFDECSTLAQTKFFSFSNSKRRKNLPKRDPKRDDATLEEMAKALRAVYREQGRGHRCSVEYCFRPNPDRHCFFAYPEDYSTSRVGNISGPVLGPPSPWLRTRRPCSRRLGLHKTAPRTRHTRATPRKARPAANTARTSPPPSRPLPPRLLPGPA